MNQRDRERRALFIVEAAEDSLEWRGIGTEAATEQSAIEFVDADAPGQSRRFYRLRWR